MIAFFNQLSGINAILYFAPRIFELTGLGAKAALLQSIGIGVTNLVFTFVGLWLIDRLGRRTLLYIGSFGYIISLGLVAWAFFTDHLSLVPVCIFAFIAAHCHWPGGGHLGVYFRDISQSSSRGRADARQLHALDFCRVAHNFLSEDGDSLPSRIRVLVLCRDDGSPTHLGEDHGSGDEGRAAGGDTEAVGDRVEESPTSRTEREKWGTRRSILACRMDCNLDRKKHRSIADNLWNLQVTTSGQARSQPKY